jgi:hypothetical protein
VAGSGKERAIAELLASTPGVPIAFDSILEDRDAEYLEARALDGMARP